MIRKTNNCPYEISRWLWAIWKQSKMVKTLLSKDAIGNQEIVGKMFCQKKKSSIENVMHTAAF